MTLSIPGYDFKIKSGEGGWYTAYVQQQGTPQAGGVQSWYQVGTLELFDDEDGQWVNNIEVVENWRRQGIGTALIAAAIATHGTIYFSNAPEDPDDDGDDTRHCSEEAAALAEHCIANAMDVEWHTPGWVRDAEGSEDDEEGENDTEGENDEEGD